MTYEAFKKKLVQQLEGQFPAGTCISIRQFPHNNHVVLDGLTVLEPGSNISPTIYLNHYFTKYQEGLAFPEIETQILGYYYSHRTLRQVDTSFFTRFEQVSPRIAYKLIHYGKNKELLEEVPYIPYLDLALVFYCLLQETPYGNASILVRQEHLEYWKVSKEELFAVAQRNTPKLLPACCESLADLILPVLKELPEGLDGLDKEFLESESVPMYVLTNRWRLDGACCMLYPGVLAQTAERLGGSLYLLPSSIHEVIVIPVSAAGDPKELTGIVREINLTEVLPEEVLSDQVYCYDRESGQLALA